MTRIGLVGCGRWGANVLRDLVSLGADVVAADPDPVKRDAASAAGATASVERTEQLPECDGFVVVTPATAHRGVVLEVLRRGTPVFVEKPPCTTLVDVEHLAAHGDGRLFVMHKWRWHPGIRELARIAASGRLGTPLELRTTRIGPEPLPDSVDVVWHLGAHDLSIALEVLGNVPPVLRATGTRDAVGRLTACEVFMANDTGKHAMRVGAGASERSRTVELRGTDGFAILERADAGVIVVETQHGREEVALPSTMPLEAELRDFLAHVEGGPPPRSSADDAVTIARRMTDIQLAIVGPGA
ncbi:MAG TPA: Gfo/Idh/MocA family oxidoreductase [Acidimicrobiia bacterium]